jgi:BlaI family transcriptional regulator, penicillinase repressor
MENLTKGELEVMQVLWKCGTLKPAEIQGYFSREIGNAALRSVLLILLDKGQVTRKMVGKAYYYKAKSPPRGELSKLTRRLADAFCGGSTKALIAELIRSEKLTDEDIRELEAIAKKKGEKS